MTTKTPDYRAIAAAAARRNGIPEKLFVNQIAAESNFNPTAGSPAGAQGIAQIMPGTAKGWGVDPMNPVAALNAAAKAMAKYTKSYGGYRNALVAYNAGPGRVGKKLYPETASYIDKIMSGYTGPTTIQKPQASTSDIPTASSTSSVGSNGSRFTAPQKAALAMVFDHQPQMKALLGQIDTFDAQQPKVDVVRPTNGTKQAVVAGAGDAAGQDLVRTALAEVGKTANDAMKYIKAAGGTGKEPWCGDFVQWVYKQRGLKVPPARSVPALMAWAKKNNKLTSAPKPGDLVTFDWNGDGTADHVEMVRKKIKGGVATIGGNTGMPGGGVGVAAKNRYGNILGYVAAA